jgi:hypothetical protein
MGHGYGESRTVVSKVITCVFGVFVIVIIVSETIGQPTCSVLVYAWILQPQSQV